MRILAIDTAAHICAACIYDADEGKVLSSISEDIGRGHAERLMDIVAESLAAASMDYSQVEKIVVTTGPGSFTGIRVGLATARGIALGLKIPIAGVSTLEGLAFMAKESHDGPLVTLIDAKRGEVFTQFSNFNGKNDSKGDPMIASLESVTAMIEKMPSLSDRIALCGSGAAALNATMGRKFKVIHDHATPSIEVVAKLGAEKPIDKVRPEPLYLREADAKPQTGFSLPRLG